MTFAFDEQFAMFDITPVENQFILEYLPGAKGDYVKVYLYGLLCCYHPKKEMDLSSMSRELGMTEDEILFAFRYWERKGVVRRVQDRPPAWQYINIKQKNLIADEAPEPDYVQFCRELELCFEGVREFHGSEMAACYEWKEALGLPTEVILMLLRHMKNTRGKSFKIRDAEKVAMMLSDEKAFTIEDAEHVLARDEAMHSGFRKVLRKLGMRFNPSDANLQLYRKWTQEWHFTQEAIEDACDRTGTSEAYTFSMLHTDVMLNLTHALKFTRGRKLNVLPYLGAGLVWRFDNPRFDMGADFGLMLRYYIGRHSDLYADFKYLMVPPRIGGGVGPEGPLPGMFGYNVVWVGLPSITLGYIYNFGTNTTRYRQPAHWSPSCSD